jgi:glycosyltransferase involved in cell wall biosynthesis
VGGAELALLTMCEAWWNAGHIVRLYNSPTSHGSSPFTQYPIENFTPSDDRDILIIFRSPNRRIKNAKGLKIWWSTDQYTVGNFREFAKSVDRIVTISEFHARHFEVTYGVKDTVTIDLPVRTQDYVNGIEKVPNRLIYCSVPDRGLSVLAQAYPSIQARVPDVSLTVTSDYRLWGVSYPGNEQFIRKFLGMKGVKFMGAIPRREMVREQQLAQVQSYPCVYDELFCYSVAECEVAGAYPVTTQTGAVATTNMGRKIEGSPSDSARWVGIFADAVVETLLDPNLQVMQDQVRQKALERFSLEKVLAQWEDMFDSTFDLVEERENE